MFDPAAETEPVEERARRQNARLRALVDRLLAVDGVQGRRLRSAGVSGGADLTHDDPAANLAGLPTAGKADLWEHYPWGLLAVPREQVRSVHGSSGTAGRPTLVAYTRADLDLWAAMCARALGMAGAEPGSVIHNAYGYGLFTGGLGLHQGAHALGATVVPASGGMTARQVTLIRDLRPDILCCTPSYAVRLGEELGRTSGIRAGLFGAEPWSEGLRATIESLLGLAALDIYGLSEVIGPGVSAECLAKDGLHVNEDHFLVEALDPATGRPVPDGTPGELTFTTPTKEALPLLRYRTGDIASLNRARCACGRTLVRMSKIIGRRDDMVVVRGVNVYPSEVEAVLLADGAVGPHYQVVLDTRTALSRLVVACEPAAGAGSEGPGDPADRLVRALHERLGLSCEVRVLPPGSVPRVEVGKAVRLVRWTGGPPPVPNL
jgi:phenylacetate-coenzyme A ligase PaaK-like adenylate-forming protein